jgi:hypothetical protein
LLFPWHARPAPPWLLRSFSRHYNKEGWPLSSNIPGYGPSPSEAQQNLIIDTLQDWKTEHYMELIGSGAVDTRPGVLRLMDEAKSQGLKARGRICAAHRAGALGGEAAPIAHCTAVP